MTVGLFCMKTFWTYLSCCSLPLSVEHLPLKTRWERTLPASGLQIKAGQSCVLWSNMATLKTSFHMPLLSPATSTRWRRSTATSPNRCFPKDSSALYDSKYHIYVQSASVWNLLMCLQMDREITAKELMDRTEIRKNVTLALTSLPVSSLLDVEQMTSALLQSTVGKRPTKTIIMLTQPFGNKNMAPFTSLLHLSSLLRLFHQKWHAKTARRRFWKLPGSWFMSWRSRQVLEYFQLWKHGAKSST